MVLELNHLDLILPARLLLKIASISTSMMNTAIAPIIVNEYTNAGITKINP